jgi:hypothetical protein
MDAIEQAEKQEPVAVWELFEDGWDSIADPEWMESLPIGTKLYTAPPQQEKQEPVAWAEERTMLACVVAQVISQPQREWIGLTDDEIDDIWNRYCDEMGEASINDAYDIARAIEAAHGIKEKNT